MPLATVKMFSETKGFTECAFTRQQRASSKLNPMPDEARMPNSIGRVVLAAAFAMAAPCAHAGPCAAAIDRLQAQVDAKIDAIAGGGLAAAETRAARLHYQPTPASIAAAEQRLRESEGTKRALAALARARKADEAGRAEACAKALAQARAAIDR